MQLKHLYKNIHQYIKAKAKSYQGKPSKEFLKYETDLKRSTERPFKLSNKDELVKSCLEAKIIYLGDFHTFDQSTRNFNRLVNILGANHEPFIIGLEMCSYRHQNSIDAYLEGNITESEFLEDIDYHKNWRFPWNHYQFIFDYAKKNKVPVVGMNSSGSLFERDLKASEIIADMTILYEKEKVLVLFGEYHIDHTKIPTLVQKQFKENIKQTIIHQNLEDLYWKVEKYGPNSIVRFQKTDEFHLQSSPPWVKYESMIYWYEHLLDDDFEKNHFFLATKVMNHEALDTFHLIVKELTPRFSMKVENHDFHLYDQTEIKKVKAKIEKLNHKPLRDYYHYLLSHHQTFCFDDLIYCPNYSLNRLAFAAGLYSFQAKKLDYEFNPVLNSFWGFLFSKIINPARKCDLYLDYLLKYKTAEPNEKIILSLFFDVLEKKPIKLDSLSLEQKHLWGKYLGQLLAHYFYQSMLKGEKEYLNKISLWFNQKDRDLESLIDLCLRGHNFKVDRKNYF